MMRGYWSEKADGRPRTDRKKAIEEDFVPYVRGIFDAKKEIRSAMLTVAQYWADEADDAVHATVLFSARTTPLWPHPCAWGGEEERAVDPTEFCSSCGDAAGWMPFDDNGHSIPTFQPCCREDASQESGTTEAYLPYAVARRVGDTDAIEVELVGGPVRAWLDHAKYTPSEGYEDEEDEEEEAEDGDDDVDGVMAPVIPDPTPKRDPQTQELFDMVFAEPEDDGPRQVLADHLLQKDDPLGHYIAVSLAASTTSDAKKQAELRARADELEARHGGEWLGPLRVFTPPEYVKFSRGLLRSLAVYFDDDDQATKVADAIEWGSVEDLRFLPQSKQKLNGAMKSLRSVGPLDVDGVAQVHWLAKGLQRLAHVHVRLENGAMMDKVAALDLPALRSLTLGAQSASFGGAQAAGVVRNPFTGEEMTIDYERPDMANISPESIATLRTSRLWTKLDELTLVSCLPACIGAWADYVGERPKTIAFSSAIPLGPTAGFRIRMMTGDRVIVDMPSIGGQMTTGSLGEMLAMLPASAKIEVASTKWFSPKDRDLEELRDLSKRTIQQAG